MFCREFELNGDSRIIDFVLTVSKKKHLFGDKVNNDFLDYEIVYLQG